MATWQMLFEASYSEYVLAEKVLGVGSTANDANLRQLSTQLFQCDLDDQQSPKALSIFAHAFAIT